MSKEKHRTSPHHHNRIRTIPQALYSEAYQEEVQGYRNYLTTLGYQPKTVQVRTLSLKEFFKNIEHQQIDKLEQITTQEIEIYHNHLQNKTSKITGRALNPKTIYEKMRNVQQYFGYCLETGKITINPASHFTIHYPTQATERILLTKEQVQELYEVADQQERMILHMAYGCGLRVQEISDLNQEDLKLNENLLIVQQGKNNKRRIIPITATISQALQAFLFSIGGTKEQALLHNNRGNRMHSWTLNSRLKAMISRTAFGKALSKEEFNKIGIHTLRHSISTHLLENGMKLEQVQTFLGHSQLETTQLYTHVSTNQINALFNQETDDP